MIYINCTVERLPGYHTLRVENAMMLWNVEFYSSVLVLSEMSKEIWNLIILHSVAEGIWAGKFGGGCSKVLYLQRNDIFCHKRRTSSRLYRHFQTGRGGHCKHQVGSHLAKKSSLIKDMEIQKNLVTFRWNYGTINDSRSISLTSPET